MWILSALPYGCALQHAKRNFFKENLIDIFPTGMRKNKIKNWTVMENIFALAFAWERAVRLNLSDSKTPVGECYGEAKFRWIQGKTS